MLQNNNKNIINNKEDIKEFIHDIHDYIRNHGMGYGMDALKIFNLFYGIKIITDNNLFKKFNIDKNINFYKLIKLNDGDLINYILGNGKYFDKGILDYIWGHNILKCVLFYDLPKNIKGKDIKNLLNKIKNIKSDNHHLSGKIYEYFIGRDKTTISELGAYYTDRHIINYIYKKLDIKINKNNSIKSMIDMFGGSGGFTIGYIHHLQKLNKNINWEVNINKIHHYDMNKDVIMHALFEMFCMIKITPNIKDINNLCQNSFTFEYKNKYDLILTNPPYGGDKIKKTSKQLKRDKIDKYIKKLLEEEKDDDKIDIYNLQLSQHKILKREERKEAEKKKVKLDNCSNLIRNYIKLYNNKLSKKSKDYIKCNDKESCSLLLMMSILKTDGSCVTILKEGLFFDKKYRALRKYLILNFNVYSIVSIPSDQFENTITKTSIIFFRNTKQKTKEIKFYDLIVNQYKNNIFDIDSGTGFIYLKNNKGEINGNEPIIEKFKGAATIEVIINNEYSLSQKKYTIKDLVPNKNYKLVKLGDIISFLPKSKRLASFGVYKGKFNFYTSSNIIKKCNIADYKKDAIIIGDGGKGSIHYDKYFSSSSHTKLLYSNNNLIKINLKLTTKFIYHIIKIFIKNLFDLMDGSTIKNINKENLINFKIPIPKEQKVIDKWTDKLNFYYDKVNELQDNKTKYNKLLNEFKKEATILTKDQNIKK